LGEVLKAKPFKGIAARRGGEVLAVGTSSLSDITSSSRTVSHRWPIASRLGSSKFSANTTLGSLSIPWSPTYRLAMPDADPESCVHPVGDDPAAAR